MDIILDQIAIWMPCGSKELNLRSSPSGIRYRIRGVNIYKTADSPILRYAKDYSIGKWKTAVKFCLFVRSFNEDAKAVEAALDDVASQITKDEVLKATANATSESFTYTQYFLEDE